MNKSYYHFRINSKSQLSQFASVAAIIIACLLVIIEIYIGNSYTNIVVMLYLSFLIPAVTLTKKVRLKFFFYIQEYAFAVRSFSIVMCSAFLIIWCIATVNEQVKQIPF